MACGSSWKSALVTTPYKARQVCIKAVIRSPPQPLSFRGGIIVSLCLFGRTQKKKKREREERKGKQEERSLWDQYFLPGCLLLPAPHTSGSGPDLHTHTRTYNTSDTRTQHNGNGLLRKWRLVVANNHHFQLEFATRLNDGS